MPEVTYTGGGHYRVGGYGFDPGTTQDVDGELASYLADHDDFTVDVEETGDVKDSGGMHDSEALAPFHPQDHKVSEIKELVATNDYSDAELEALADAEREHDDRTTAVEAIEEA